MENGLFLQASARQNAPFSTCGQQSVKIRGSYPPCFPDSSVILWISHPLYFPSPAGERKIFLPFAQRSELLLSGRADRFWLVDRQPFQEPAVFLAAEVPYFRRIPRPLEPAIIQTFIIKAEPIFFEMQRFYPVAASSTEKEQGVAVRI